MPKLPDKKRNTSKNASFPYLVLAVSLFLTVGIGYSFHQNAKTKDKIRFNNEINRLQSAVENKVNIYIALLKGGRGFIEANRRINRQNFSEYVSSLEMEKNYTGVQGIGYAQTVKVGERESFTKKMKSEDYTDFRIFPAAEKESFQIISYLEPSNDRNRKDIGFDMSSISDWQETLNRAVDSGMAAASGKINLAQPEGTANQTGFLICLPIYKGGGSHSNVQDRRKNISGFIYSPFPSERFLGEIQNNQPSSDILIKIYDRAVGDENLLMQSAGSPNVESRSEGNYSVQNELDVAGRKWIIRFNSSPIFAAQSNVGWTPLILIAGLIFSLLLFGMTYWETFARLKMQATAAELFDLQMQKQELLEKEQQARLSAEQANKTKDEFIAVVSHELRTPLNAIAGWSRILKSEELSANTKTLALEKIEKNLRSQTKLVEQLLNYSQIMSGTAEFENREFSFSNVFEGVYAEMEPQAQGKNIHLVKNNSLNGQMILGDENKIKHVIYNLLNNAVKFTSSGGNIEIVVAEKNDQIEMRVSDDGKGINENFLPYIFDQFTQADSSTTRRSGGLGLGLTISNHIIKHHHGTIAVFSGGEGKGTVFTVTLPNFAENITKTQP